MPNYFNLKKMQEVAAENSNEIVTSVIETMIRAKLSPSVYTALVDVKYNTLVNWIYGRRIPRQELTIKKIETLNKTIDKALNSGYLSRATAIKVDDLQKWYRTKHDIVLVKKQLHTFLKEEQ